MVQTIRLKGKIADHPKLLGVLWALTLFLVEVGSVLATEGHTTGP